MILLYLRHELEPDDDDLDWLHVLHTCRRWRILALSSPAFWQAIDMKEGRQRTFFLKHAKRSPITVLQGLDREIEQILTEHLDHIGTLILYLNAMQAENWIAKFLAPESAPLLKTLELFLNRNGSEPLVDVPDVTWTLSRLRLSNCCLRLSSSRPQPNVTNLSLQYTIAPAASLIRAEYTLRLLRSMPNLTVLDIHDIHDSALELHDHLDIRTIFLPSLQNISFYGTLHGFNLLFNIIRASPRCKFTSTVHTSGPEHHDEEVEDFYLQLQSFLLRRFSDNAQTQHPACTVNFVDHDGGFHDRGLLEELVSIEERCSHPSNPSGNTIVKVALIHLTHHAYYLRTGDRALNNLSNFARGLPGSCIERVVMASRVVFDLTSSRTGALQGGSLLPGALQWNMLKILQLDDIGSAQWLLFALTIFEGTISLPAPLSGRQY